jgi:hypothetical protein
MSEAEITAPAMKRGITPKGVRGVEGPPNGKTARRRAWKALMPEAKREARRARRRGQKAAAPKAVVAAPAVPPAKKKGK